MSAELALGNLSSIERLSSDSISKSISVCGNGDSDLGDKRAWYLKNSATYNGYIGLVSGEPRAILEYMQCDLCPYPVVPKENSALVILCLYSNDDYYDYRGSLLKFLFEDIANQSWDRVYVISGENGHYPNGTAPSFKRFGFSITKDLGSTWIKGQGIDNLYLMEKRLREV